MEAFKGDVRGDLSTFKGDVYDRLAGLESRIIRWFVGTALVLAGTVAMIVALIK
jgi:hypothetical protein